VDYRTDEILMVNDYYARMLGVSKDRMEGRRCWEYVAGPDEGPCEFCPRDMDLDGNGFLDTTPQTIEAYNPTLGIWGRCTGKAIDWVDGRPAHIITITDISNEKLLREELSRLAYYDKYLNLPNRTKLERDLAARLSGNYCIIAFDYISLRYINDAYGRYAGDALMKTVIKWIEGFHLQNFEIYRIGGDEFCMLFDNADMISASGLADRLHERFQEPWEVVSDHVDTFISCKISVCVIDGRMGFDNPEHILSVVERTLGISKETGAVAVYNHELDMLLKRDLELEISLKNCVTEGMRGFDVYFQPIVDPVRGVWRGLEALCRWESPEFGWIPPLVFIRMAEQIGLINSVGYWVLNRAIATCARLGLHEVDNFFLDVNLSASQMADETLVPKILTTLQHYGFPGENLVLEVTESEKVDMGDYSMTTIERLHALNIKMALDDFGTGYSNFNNLKNLPVSILKTEKQFIDDIVADKYQQHLSHLLVDLAHTAGMKLISEGVETLEQMRELRKNNVDYFQGFLFSRPLDAATLEHDVNKFVVEDAACVEMLRELNEGDGGYEGHAGGLEGSDLGLTSGAGCEIGVGLKGEVLRGVPVMRASDK
jgi:diguanylate cyclase (GGDEF)-like protein